jgi:hypothetical protein
MSKQVSEITGVEVEVEPIRLDVFLEMLHVEPVTRVQVIRIKRQFIFLILIPCNQYNMLLKMLRDDTG